MIIRKYKLFEEKLQTQEELSELLDMAIDTEELELVEFFVRKGSRSTDNTMEKASWTKDIFKHLLDNKYKLNISERRLQDSDVQKILIDYNKHKYIFEELGYFNRELKKDEKYKNSVDNFYKEHEKTDTDGTDYQHAFEWAKDDKELFKYFTTKGDFKSLSNSILREPEAQKALIDLGYDQFIYDGVGFNQELKEDPKYSKWLDMEEEFDKFNL